MIPITYECPVDAAIDLPTPLVSEHLLQILLVVIAVGVVDKALQICYSWQSSVLSLSLPLP
jgi:hypothetical protein